MKLLDFVLLQFHIILHLYIQKQLECSKMQDSWTNHQSVLKTSKATTVCNI